MYPNCIYITIRAYSIILAKRSIAHIFDSIDAEATSEVVDEITKLPPSGVTVTVLQILLK